MKIALCEDDPLDLKRLHASLEQALARMSIEADVVPYASSNALLCALEQGAVWDMCFLDIYMPETDGIQLADRISTHRPHTVFAFITNSDEHMADGFRLGAVHYLLKPFTEADVDEALSRALRLVGHAARYIELVVDRLNQKIPLDSIVYVESQNRGCVLHTTQGVLRSYVRLEALNEMLDDRRFLRCHRSFLVNMDHVRRVLREDFEIDNGLLVPLRREQRTELREAYFRYCTEKTRGRY